MITPAEVITLGTALPTASIIIVALRFYVKHTKVKSTALNDYLILLSLLCSCGSGATIVYGSVTQGYGRVSPPAVTTEGVNADSSPEISITRHLTWSFVCISTFTYGLAKLSVLLFYRSIFVGRAFNFISTVLVTLTCIWTLTTFFFLFFQCGRNYRAVWTDAAYVAKHCLSGFADGLSAAVTDVFLDLTILILPIYWVMRLHMSLKKRLSVVGVFLFGVLAIVSSIARLIAVSLVYPDHNHNPNQFAYMTTLVYFGQLEAGLCVIAASLPTLGPLLFPNRLQLAKSTNKSSYYTAKTICRSRSKFDSTASTVVMTEPQPSLVKSTVVDSSAQRAVKPRTPISTSAHWSEHLDEDEISMNA